MVMVMVRKIPEMRIALIASYSELSTARGALFSFVFITDSGDVDFSRSFLLALDKNTSHNHTLPFDLYPGHCSVYVYDIEHDGTLHNGVGYPAVTTNITMESGINGTCSKFQGINTVIAYLNISQVLFCIGEAHLQPFNCTLKSTSGLILAECSHPNSSFATGIQVIVQSTSVSEVHKLYINQSMDLQTPVTVPVERDGEYLVFIFAIREGMGILGSSIQYESVTVIVNPSIHTTASAISTKGVGKIETNNYSQHGDTGVHIIIKKTLQ